SSRLTSPTSTCGTTTAGRPSTGRSWAGPTSCSGTATTRCTNTPLRSRRWRPSCGGSMASARWYLDRRLWLEAVALAHLGGLAPDIYLAHSVNLFRHAAEYIPFVYSLLAPVVLLAALVALYWGGSWRWWRWLGLLVGWTAVAVGVVGLVLHLGSRFFYENT